MKEFPDESVDLVIVDPPYYKIKNDHWDNQFKSFEDYLNWIEMMALEIKRVLKQNGSFYIFGDDHRIAYIQVRLDQHFTFLNHLIWHKPNNTPIKYAHNFHSFCPVSERILFYSKQGDKTGLETVKLDINNFQPLRQYFKDFQEALGLSLKEINKILGHRKAEHAFYWNSTQWDLPTKETYKELCKLPLKYEFVRREYEDLRREYEDLRREYEDLRREYEDLRRVFNYIGEYEIIKEPIITLKENTEHTTTKPIRVIEKLILSSSNEEFTVLDCCLGSGTTAIACENLNRQWIGIEKEKKYCDLTVDRLNKLEKYQPIQQTTLEVLC